MAIKSNTETHTVSWLKMLDDEGKLNKNISIQRKEVWDAEKKSNLIISMLLNIPIESLLFEENENGYNVLDGKQRTLTLCAYLADGFSLSPKIRVQEIDGVSVTGLKYSQLPEVLQNRIAQYQLAIAILRPLDSEERATVFFMRNQAVALTKIDLSLVMLGEQAMNTFNNLCAHPFMMEKIKLTVPARRKHDDLSILLQYLILRQRPEMGFSGSEIMSFCDDIKSGEAQIEADAIRAVMDYLNTALTEKRQYLKKIHVPVVLYAAQEAMESGTEPAVFANRLDEFFASASSNMEYVNACTSGSAKRTNVQTRVRVVTEALA